MPAAMASPRRCRRRTKERTIGERFSDNGRPGIVNRRAWRDRAVSSTARPALAPAWPSARVQTLERDRQSAVSGSRGWLSRRWATSNRWRRGLRRMRSLASSTRHQRWRGSRESAGGVVRPVTSSRNAVTISITSRAKLRTGRAARHRAGHRILLRDKGRAIAGAFSPFSSESSGLGKVPIALVEETGTGRIRRCRAAVGKECRSRVGREFVLFRITVASLPCKHYELPFHGAYA